MSKWVECCKHLNIGELWEASKKDQSQILPNLYELKKACTVSSKNNTIHSVDAPLTMPLSKIKDDVTVWFLVKDIEVETDIQSSSGSTFAKNTFIILMTKTKVNVTLKQVNNKKDELFSDLVNLKQLTCYQEQLQNINILIQCLMDALWSLDGNHSKLNKAHSNGHCFQLPQYFAKIYQKESYDWKNRKRAKPTLTHEKMLTCSNKLFDAVSLWDNVKFPAAQLLNASHCLAECMRSYTNHLKKAQERMTAN